LPRDTVFDLLDMPLEDGDRSLLILEGPAEGPLPDEGVDHAARVGRTRGVRAHPADLIDRIPGALVPALWVAHREQRFRRGVRLHELLVEGARGPVHDGVIAREELIPVD